MNHLVMITLDRLISDVTELRAEVRELTKAVKKLHQKEDEAKRDDLLKDAFRLWGNYIKERRTQWTRK